MGLLSFGEESSCLTAKGQRAIFSYTLPSESAAVPLGSASSAKLNQVRFAT